jgi:hypothetical protein
MPRTSTPAPQFLGLCGVCIKKAVIMDALRFSWCEDHQHRATISAYGVATKFRAVSCGIFAIGEGEDLWKTALAVGTNARNEEFMRAVYASIQSTDAQTSEQADVSQKGA